MTRDPKDHADETPSSGRYRRRLVIDRPYKLASASGSNVNLMAP
jgi:hypothetical protein